MQCRIVQCSAGSQCFPAGGEIHQPYSEEGSQEGSCGLGGRTLIIIIILLQEAQDWLLWIQGFQCLVTLHAAEGPTSVVL